MKSDLLKLQQQIQYTFRKSELLIEALTHPSYCAENRASESDNQRLEFLGDAVIQIIITKKIYFLYPDLPEGKLTKIRSALSKQSALAEFARQFDLGSYLLLGHGERLNKGHERNSILCDAFESLIASIFLDESGALSSCEGIINRCIDSAYSATEILALVKTENPKGTLQEWSQKHFSEVPTYELRDESGPDHEKSFTIEVLINGKSYGTGTARKRQAAEEAAARTAVKMIKSQVEKP